METDSGKRKDANALRDHANDSVTDSCGNVFADLDLNLSDLDMLKIQIARAISATIERRQLTQVQAAKILETDQAKVSALLRGRLKTFSVERLFRFLAALGRDANIHIPARCRANERGRIKVMAA